MKYSAYSASPMMDFVPPDSIVRRIWGNGDLVLLVFAGSAAEFALNRAVDWLFFTGKLPNDPMARLFATASYAQKIVFADQLTAAAALDRIRAVHQSVERRRGQSIPDWAHRDVLYMLIDYSERAHELLARPLSTAERNDLYDVFHRVGTALRIPELPMSYAEWRIDRERHLRRDLICGDGTNELYAAYRRQLGPWRYRLLLHLQSILAPAHVRGLLRLTRVDWSAPCLRLYPLVIRAGMRSLIHRLLVPAQYLSAVRALDQRTPRSLSTETAFTAAHPAQRRVGFQAGWPAFAFSRRALAPVRPEIHKSDAPKSKSPVFSKTSVEPSGDIENRRITLSPAK